METYAKLYYENEIKKSDIPEVIKTNSFKEKLEAIANQCGWKLAKFDRLYKRENYRLLCYICNF